MTLHVAAIVNEALDVEGDAPGLGDMTRVLSAAYHPKVEQSHDHYVQNTAGGQPPDMSSWTAAEKRFQTGNCWAIPPPSVRSDARKSPLRGYDSTGTEKGNTETSSVVQPVLSRDTLQKRSCIKQ